jgi:ABC-type taurine transport system ATPase subunit
MILKHAADADEALMMACKGVKMLPSPARIIKTENKTLNIFRQSNNAKEGLACRQLT